MKTPAPPLPGAILACGLALACCSARGGSPDMPWSFSAPPYVHPRIIEDLSTWLSDGGDQVVAINLLDAQGSNRYHGDILTREGPGGASFVYTRDGRAMFGYEHVGTTTSGVHVLLTSDCGGGTGVFVDLMLVRIETDRGFAVDWEGGAIRPARRRLRQCHAFAACGPGSVGIDSAQAASCRREQMDCRNGHSLPRGATKSRGSFRRQSAKSGAQPPAAP